MPFAHWMTFAFSVFSQSVSVGTPTEPLPCRSGLRKRFAGGLGNCKAFLGTELKERMEALSGMQGRYRRQRLTPFIASEKTALAFFL